MISVYKFVLGLCVPMGAREFHKKSVDIKISVYENLLDCDLSWQERENCFYKLSDLYYYKYVIDNVRNAEVHILPEEYDYLNGTIENDKEDLNNNGWWYFDY